MFQTDIEHFLLNVPVWNGFDFDFHCTYYAKQLFFEPLVQNQVRG